MPDPAVPVVAMELSEPPLVINSGRGTHGIRRLTDRFELPELWSVHLYGYRGTLEVGGRVYPIAPGTVSVVPPATPHGFRYRGPSSHLYAHLRAEGDRGLTDPTGRSPSRRRGQLQLIMSAGADLAVITDLMESAIRSAGVRPERTRADIWGVLLRLADRPAATGGPTPAEDHLLAAASWIESRLPEQVRVSEVADAIGVSANHLARVFRAETGGTVVGYIRRRRMDRARQLLATSTMSIGAVAAAVGVPDLQAFNKLCRAMTGRSPRQLRGGIDEDGPGR